MSMSSPARLYLCRMPALQPWPSLSEPFRNRKPRTWLFSLIKKKTYFVGKHAFEEEKNCSHMSWFLSSNRKMVWTSLLLILRPFLVKILKKTHENIFFSD